MRLKESLNKAKNLLLSVFISHRVTLEFQIFQSHNIIRELILKKYKEAANYFATGQRMVVSRARASLLIDIKSFPEIKRLEIMPHFNQWIFLLAKEQTN